MNSGHAMAQLVEAQSYKLEGRGFDVSVTDNKITNRSTGVGFFKNCLSSCLMSVVFVLRAFVLKCQLQLKVQLQLKAPCYFE
jgi:hypothetical protein